jgi:hypothetical protein
MESVSRYCTAPATADHEKLADESAVSWLPCPGVNRKGAAIPSEVVVEKLARGDHGPF